MTDEANIQDLGEWLDYQEDMAKIQPLIEDPFGVYQVLQDLEVTLENIEKCDKMSDVHMLAEGALKQLRQILTDVTIIK